MMAICLGPSLVVALAILPVDAITLAWRHSVEQAR